MPYDVSNYIVTNPTCETCGEAYFRVTGFVDEDDRTLCSYYAVLHGHPEHEIAVDMTLGSWGEGADYGDHVTFSCLLRPQVGAMLVDGFVTMRNDAATHSQPVFGKILDREAALAHPLRSTFWALIDELVLVVDPIAAEYGNRPHPH